MTSQQPMQGASASATATCRILRPSKTLPPLNGRSIAARSICLSPGASSIPKMKNFLITSDAANLSRMAGLPWMRWKSSSAPRGATGPKRKLHLAQEAVGPVEKLIASECVNWQLSDLQSEHRRVFSNVITLDCPPYETLFGNDHVFAQSHVMGDIAGFYKAFGVELSKDIHERLDHLSVEFEFMHFLCL